MRISIWQQFSSNHSASFMIIGTFETPEKAAQVAEEFRSFLRAVAGYWQQLDPKQRQIQTMWRDITPVESALSQKYDLTLEHGLDWLPADPDKAEKAVVLYNSSVFVENIGNTYIGSEPFETLLRKFGAQVAGWREKGDGCPSVRLTCDAPDEIVAQRILDAVEPEYMTGPKGRTSEKPIALVISDVLRVDEDSQFLREGTKLTFEMINFGIFTDEFLSDLSKIIDFLTGQGCTHIACEFYETPGC